MIVVFLDGRHGNQTFTLLCEPTRGLRIKFKDPRVTIFHNEMYKVGHILTSNGTPNRWPKE